MEKSISAQNRGSRLLGKKWFLYVTEFFSGMSVMAIELGASRLLAPYFSSSQIVWTVIIGAIMIAMAVGNVWGGRLADKTNPGDKLYVRLLTVGVWICAVPFVGKYVIAAISLLLAVLAGQNFLIFASLLTCTVLFVFPLLLLGTVSPTLAKLSVKSLDESGKTVGELGALNTIGSIIGTFLPTFVTIPAVGTSLTFVIFSAVLIAISLFYFIFEYVHISPKKVAKPLLAVVLAIGFSVFSSFSTFAFWVEDDEHFYEDESIYNYLQVTETERYQYLSTNVLFGVQSISIKNGYLTGMYYDYALAAPFLAGMNAESDGDLLILGFGTGTYAKQCLHYFPNMTIKGVEIDEKILDLSYDKFGLSKDEERLETVVFDGRAYLDLFASDASFDVIMVDAYRDITIPPQMSSFEFFTSVKEKLKAGGVMVVNLNMVSDEEGSINEYLEDTIAAVFPCVYYVNSNGNRELFAFSDETAISKYGDNLSGCDYTLYQKLSKLQFTRHEGGKYLLTDDKAPVELLGMKVIDAMIEEEISHYKELLKGKSIKEMIEIITE